MKHNSPFLDSKTSSLWDSVKGLYNNFDIDSFREIGRLGDWGAFDKSSRYYKSLMFEFAMYLDEAILKQNPRGGILSLLRKIKNQNLGSPTTIKLDEFHVSLDYLLGVEEYLFCSDVLAECKTVCEIGAGFGRTCHSIVSLSSVEKYIIVDLPEILELSKVYLSKVLSVDDFEKIQFVCAEEYDSVAGAELFINIDSLQEMPIEVGRSYIEFISRKAKFFFSKNVLGKYLPSDIDLEVKNKKEYDLAMNMGLITDIFPLFDTSKRTEAVKLYHKAYCPKGFEVKKTQRGFGQYLSYELSLFSKKI